MKAFSIETRYKTKSGISAQYVQRLSTGKYLFTAGKGVFMVNDDGLDETGKQRIFEAAPLRSDGSENAERLKDGSSVWVLRPGNIPEIATGTVAGFMKHANGRVDYKHVMVRFDDEATAHTRMSEEERKRREIDSKAISCRAALTFTSPMELIGTLTRWIESLDEIEPGRLSGRIIDRTSLGNRGETSISHLFDYKSEPGSKSLKAELGATPVYKDVPT